MVDISRIFGANNVANTTGIQKANRTDKVDISFVRANKAVSNPRELNPSTMNFLASLDGKITSGMAEDLLAIPYVSLDFNG